MPEVDDLHKEIVIKIILSFKMVSIFQVAAGDFFMQEQEQSTPQKCAKLLK